MIKVNYSKTRSVTNRLNYAANTCNEMTAEARKLISTIPTCWLGESATAFSSELSDWIREDRAIQTELNDLASDIIRIANEFEETEKRIAAEVARAAASGGDNAYGSGKGGGGIC